MDKAIQELRREVDPVEPQLDQRRPLRSDISRRETKLQDRLFAYIARFLRWTEGHSESFLRK